MDIGDPHSQWHGLYDLVGPVFVRSKTEGSELPRLTLHLGCCVRGLAGALLVGGMGENWGAWQPPAAGLCLFPGVLHFVILEENLELSRD